jgi:hypothetical protein
MNRADLLLAIYILLGVLVLLLWVRGQIRYRVSRHHLEINLFGLPLRRIKLVDIRRVAKRSAPWRCERWPNALFSHKRRLLVERASGSPKYILITPEYRYEFKSELEQAIQRSRTSAAAETTGKSATSQTG